MTAAPSLAPLRGFWKDSSPSAFLSGLIAILIGWAGPNVLIYAVAKAARFKRQHRYVLALGARRFYRNNGHFP